MRPINHRQLQIRLAVVAAVAAAAALLLSLGATQAATKLPPRPTPAVTLTPTPTPLPLPARRETTVREPLAHIRLAVTPAAAGLWAVVQWQGGDGVWHDVAGWQGVLPENGQRWAVEQRNFGEGPFRWVVYDRPGGKELASSAPFDLPAQDGEELSIEIPPIAL